MKIRLPLQSELGAGALLVFHVLTSSGNGVAASTEFGKTYFGEIGFGYLEEQDRATAPSDDSPEARNLRMSELLWQAFVALDAACDSPQREQFVPFETNLSDGFLAIANGEYSTQLGVLRWDTLRSLHKLTDHQGLDKSGGAIKLEGEALDQVEIARNVDINDVLQDALVWGLSPTKKTVVLHVSFLAKSCGRKWVVAKRGFEVDLKPVFNAAQRRALLLDVARSICCLFHDLKPGGAGKRKCVKTIRKLFKEICPDDRELLKLIRSDVPNSQWINVVQAELARIMVDELMQMTREQAIENWVERVSDLDACDTNLILLFLQALNGKIKDVSTSNLLITRSEDQVAATRKHLQTEASMSCRDAYMSNWTILRHLIQVVSHNPTVSRKQPFRICVNGNYHRVHTGRENNETIVSFPTRGFTFHVTKIQEGERLPLLTPSPMRCRRCTIL